MKFFVALFTFLATLAIASPIPDDPPSTETEAGALGESHKNVHFSAVANYPNPTNSIPLDFQPACPGFKINDPAPYVALDANAPNWSNYCGKKIKLYNPDGRTTISTIVDKCPGCQADGGAYTLDLFGQTWAEIGSSDSLNPVVGASWEIIG